MTSTEIHTLHPSPHASPRKGGTLPPVFVRPGVLGSVAIVKGKNLETENLEASVYLLISRGDG